MRSCALCGREVDVRDPLTYRRNIGWERKSLDPRRRGGSDISGRKPVDEWAHPRCVDREKAGLSVAQEALL